MLQKLPKKTYVGRVLAYYAAIRLKLGNPTRNSTIAHYHHHYPHLIIAAGAVTCYCCVQDVALQTLSLWQRDLRRRRCSESRDTCRLFSTRHKR